MRWDEMSKRQQGALVALTSVEVALTAAAAVDRAADRHRPQERP